MNAISPKQIFPDLHELVIVFFRQLPDEGPLCWFVGFWNGERWYRPSISRDEGGSNSNNFYLIRNVEGWEAVAPQKAN